MTTATEAKKETVANAIEAVVREKLTAGDIVTVKVEDGESFDGDSILVVTVILGAHERLKPRETSSLTRHLRNRLFDMDEIRFPHLSFISTKDAEKQAAA